MQFWLVAEGPLLTSYLGELSALAAAAFWAISAGLFRKIGVSVSPLVLNFYKGLLTTILLVGWIGFVGSAELRATNQELFVLFVSGAIGIGIGDTVFFAALNRLGERRSVLISATIAPPLTAIIAFLFIAETLGWIPIVGMLLTLVGVGWVIAERPRKPSARNAAEINPPVAGASVGDPAPVKAVRRNLEKPATMSAVGLALAAAACQAVGSVMSREVLGTSEIGAVGSSLVRLAGGLALLVVLIPMARQSFFVPQLRDPKLAAIICLATILGTLLGIVCQQLALQYTSAAIVQTLLATSSLFVLPIMFLGGQAVTVRGAVGALVALAGIAVLFLGK